MSAIMTVCYMAAACETRLARMYCGLLGIY